MVSPNQPAPDTPSPNSFGRRAEVTLVMFHSTTPRLGLDLMTGVGGAGEGSNCVRFAAKIGVGSWCESIMNGIWLCPRPRMTEWMRSMKGLIGNKLKLS